MKPLLITLSFFCLLTFFACSGSKQIGSEEIVEQSYSQPDWVIKGSSFNDDDNYYAVGEITKAQNRSFGLKQSYADGLQNMINTVQNTVSSISTQALEGNNNSSDDVGLYSKFAVAWASDNQRYAGVQNPEKYWEKVAVTTSTGVKYYYNCYSLLRISNLNYNKILEGAFEEMRKQARARNNKNAEETANQLLKKVQN